MSTNYDVVCLDCQDKHGFDRDELLRQVRNLVVHAPTLADMGHTFKAIEGMGLVPKLSLDDYGDDPVNLEWFAKHKGHRLAVVDEYGRLDGDCGEYFRCAGCDRTVACVLPKDHESKKHSAKRGPCSGS